MRNVSACANKLKVARESGTRSDFGVIILHFGVLNNWTLSHCPMGPCSLLSRSLGHASCRQNRYLLGRSLSSVPSPTPPPVPQLSRITPEEVQIQGQSYPRDSWTNVTERITSQIGRDLHRQRHHPLGILATRIKQFFYSHFPRGAGQRSPLFSVFDNLHPVVTLEQNFDSLLVPQDHVSRSKSDCYYINSGHLLRAHTSAHQADLIGQGLNNFLVVGDVYRRDAIDRSHYPIFHQMEGVRLCGLHDVFRDERVAAELQLFDGGQGKSPGKQEGHSTDAVMVMTRALQETLLQLVKALFGNDVESRWVDAYFPFTHPSWELEIKFNGDWMEVLGCGIMEQCILEKAGAGNKIGWAFGLGLERLAMKLFSIPDIRLFWSRDPGFLYQFKVEDPSTPITYKPHSVYPSCANDMSFWLPADNSYSSPDFYDIVRSVGSEVVEQVSLVDEFLHPGNGKMSHCYRIVYRHMEKTLTQAEVNKIHRRIQEVAVKQLRVVIR